MNLKEIKELAEIIKNSGLKFSTAQNKDMIACTIIAGLEIGMKPLESMQGFQNIQGTLTLSPKATWGLILKSGLMEEYKFEESPDTCTITARRKGNVNPVSITFTYEDAKKAGITGNAQWTKWRPNMLRWRTLGFMADAQFPDVLGGSIRPDDMGATNLDSEGALEGYESNALGNDLAEIKVEKKSWPDKTRINRAWTELKNLEFSTDDFKALLSSQFNLSSTADLTEEQMELLETQISYLQHDISFKDVYCGYTKLKKLEPPVFCAIPPPDPDVTFVDTKVIEKPLEVIKQTMDDMTSVLDLVNNTVKVKKTKKKDEEPSTEGDFNL